MPERVTELMASARAFRNRHVLGGCDSDMGCITQWEILRAEPFMPGTHRTSTYASRGIRTALGSSGALMQQGFVGRLAVSCKIRTRSFDERPASAGNSPASTPEGRTCKMTRAHMLTVERKRHGTLLPLPYVDPRPSKCWANLRNTSGTRRP